MWLSTLLGFAKGSINIVNLRTMATNAFYCPKCGKFTKHISISWREYTALMDFDTETQLLMGGVFDVLGGGALTKLALGIRPYKCTECGKASSRNLKGGIALGGDPEELKKQHWD